MIRTIQRASCPHRSAQKIIPRAIKLRDVTRQACRVAVMAALHAFPARITRRQRSGNRVTPSPNKKRCRTGEVCPIASTHPSPIRFLFFGSFFSFSERKERTEHPFSFPERKERTEKKNDQENTGWDKKAAGAGRAGRWGTLKRSGGAFSRPCSRAARPRRSRPAGAAAPFRWSFR